MTKRQDEELAKSLRTTQAACCFIGRFSLVCLILFIILWGIFFVLLAGSQANDENKIIALINSLVFGLSVILILLSVSKMFNESVKCHTPFTKNHSRWMLVIAIAFLLLALKDIILPVNEIVFASALSQFIGIEIGFEITDAAVTAAPTLNIGIVFFSLFMLCLSVIFRYGYLLQQLSDDTV